MATKEEIVFFQELLDKTESRLNKRISENEHRVSEKVATSLMQTLDNERNSQIKFQSTIERQNLELKNRIENMEDKITPKWQSLLIISICVVCFSAIIITLLVKL
jgi:beta-lactamase regulating signal transducer with metallopeptidase domain